jgi:Flp pilus assembly pilin Flp
MGRGLLRQLLVEELGQDFAEYALLLVFVVLASAGIFLTSGSSFAGLWSLSNSQVVAASAAAS